MFINLNISQCRSCLKSGGGYINSTFLKKYYNRYLVLVASDLKHLEVHIHILKNILGSLWKWGL